MRRRFSSQTERREYMCGGGVDNEVGVAYGAAELGVAAELLALPFTADYDILEI